MGKTAAHPNLSDPMKEDSLYEIESMRRFAKLRLSDRIPDETTILNFRHFLESYGLGHKLLLVITNRLASKGCSLRGGTIVDSTVFAAPSSTKNKEGRRDPEIQTKKGNQWNFGMKLHIGVDADTGLLHSAVGTSANEHDITKLPNFCMAMRCACMEMAVTRESTSARSKKGGTWNGISRPGQKHEQTLSAARVCQCAAQLEPGLCRIGMPALRENHPIKAKQGDDREIKACLPKSSPLNGGSAK